MIEEAGDIEKAVEWLRRRGVKSMEKRTAESGEALLALGLAGDAGALVELKAETDFVTRGEIFQKLSVCLAQSLATASSSSSKEALAVEDLQALSLQEAANLPKQVRPGSLVSEALLEVGSVVGEKLVVGEVASIRSPSGGVIGGYVHPKQADGLPGTGRIAALVTLLPLPAQCDADRLRAVATQLARHIVASQPRFISIASVPATVLSKERETMKAAHMAQLGARKGGTLDEQTLNKVLDGKTQKFYQETVLLCQELVSSAASQDGKPLPVAEWLQAEARSLGVEKLLVEDFKLLAL